MKKYVFVYNGGGALKKAMCTTTQEAVDFINGCYCQRSGANLEEYESRKTFF